MTDCSALDPYTPHAPHAPQAWPLRTVCMACEATDALDPDARLIELAAVAMQGGRVTGAQFHALIHPQAPIPASGTAAHGYNLEHLAHCPPWAEIAPFWLEFVQGAHLLVWNAAFHLRCLNAAMVRAGLRPMQCVAGRITDVRQVLTTPAQQPPRLQDLLAAHPQPAEHETRGPLASAHQLARLWLSLGQDAAP